MLRNLCFLAGLSALAYLVPTVSQAVGPVVHELRIVHPGDPERRNLRVVIEQHMDKDGEPSAYSTWVDSVICLEKTCEVVKVQLHWDFLGRYQRYNVAEGSKLTKLDHVPFSEEDHAKLQSILLDKSSPLREVTKEGLTGKPFKEEDGIDAITRPTLLTLKNTVVTGAGYCCYDLWHWANGDLATVLRTLSGQAFSPSALESLIGSQDEHAAAFALVQLKSRNLFSPKAVDTVVVGIQNSGDALVVPAMDYLQSALPDPQEYYAALAKAFDHCSDGKRVILLSHLADSKASFPPGALDRLSFALPGFESHHTLHLFLNLVTSKQAGSETISRNLAPLLAHKKFFVARRAYWYLEKQDLPEDLRKKAEAFHLKFQDRL